jgi:hypothetical protein
MDGCNHHAPTADYRGAQVHGRRARLRGRYAACLVVAVAGLVAGCSGPTTATPTSSTAATPSKSTLAPTTPADPSCAAALPGGHSIEAAVSLVDPIAFPPGTIGATPTQSIGGTDLFGITEFDACSPRTTANAVTAFFAASLPALPASWSPSPVFPYDGGLMQGCGAATCWSATRGVPYVYMAIERLQEAGRGAVIYHLRYAVSPDPGPCAQAGPAGQGGSYDFFVPNFGPGPQVPLPPMSRAGENDAPHLRAWDVCSPGTAASIAAFLDKELPMTGWKLIATSNPSCAFTSCWANGSQVVSWSVADAAHWSIGFR